jgi:hypothetical protein
MKNPGDTPHHTSTAFRDAPTLREEPCFSRGENTDYIMIYWTQAAGFLKDKAETEAMAALNCLDVGRLSEIPAIFRRFVKSAEGNPVSYFDIFPLSQKLRVNLGSLHANKHAETFMKDISERFSRTTDLNIIFTCFLVTQVGKRSSGDVPRPGAFTASMAAVKNRGIAALTTAFSSDVAQMTSLFRALRPVRLVKCQRPKTRKPTGSSCAAK